MNKRSLLKQLLLLLVFATSGFILKSQILTEGFEGATFPPAGWLNIHSAGPDAADVWTSATTGADGGDDANFVPFTVDPHSGTGMASFTSYDYSAGNAATLITSSFSLATPGAKIVTFWMYRDNGYDNALDSISLFINTSASASGATLLGIVHRHTLADPVVNAGPGWYSYTFTIPPSFNGANNYLVFEAMSDFGNNMFIDDVSVEEFADCTGAPTAGTITGPATSCSGSQLTLENTGATDAAGMQYYWQSAPATNGPWTNIPGQTGMSSANTSQSVATYYRLFVTCTNSGLSDSSNVLAIGMTPSYLCYCKPPDVPLHSFVNDYITNVVIQGTTLNSSNATDGNSGYTQVQPTPASNTADLSQLVTYNIVATIEDGGPLQVSCWVDFNANGTFDATEFTDLTINGASATGSITVPASAVLGQTGFRIRARAANFTNADGCGAFASGETEDYVVNITSNSALNGALVDIIPPVTGCNAGNDVVVKLRNSGNVNIPAGAATIGLFISGANPQTLPTQTNPSLLAPGDTATLTFVCSFPLDGTNLDSAAIVSLAGDVIAGDDAIVTSHITLPAPATAPFAEDFEGSVPGWTVSLLAGNGNWGLSDSVFYYDYSPQYNLAPKSGTYCALFDSYTFDAGTISRLASNCINIPADANTGCGYVAGFYFTQDAQYLTLRDSVVVLISADGGNTFNRLGVVKRNDSTLTTQSSYTPTSGIPQWKLYTFDIGSYAGQTIQIAFDAYGNFGNQMGLDSFFVGPKAVNGNVGLAGGQETGADLSPALTQCADAGGWTYYSDNNSSRYLFGIQWDPANTGANAAAKAQATAKITVDRKWYAAENIPLQMATYTMQRYWDVDLHGAAMTGPVNVRFFYSQRELDSIVAAKDNFIAANGGNDEGVTWFKTNSGAFVPSPSSVTYDGVVDALDLTNSNTTGATINGILYAQFDGITSFSGGTATAGVGPGTPLPVGLLSFNAQRTGRVNTVTWTTSQEINTDKFVVEHSTDGRNFIAVGNVVAAGNSSVNQNYSFLHNTPVRGLNFYRLNVLERNGSTKYSEVRSVRNEGSADIAIYPNPVRDAMLLNITSDKTDKAVITISDMNGKLVQVKTNTLNEGNNYINVNTSTLSRGTYIVKIQLTDDMLVRKINKL